MSKNNWIFIILLFSCILLSISFASANDNITLDDSSCNRDYQNNTFSINNNDLINSNVDIDSINKSKSFTDLNKLINGDLNKSEIILEDDYIYQEEYDRDFAEGIFINRSVTIDGQGHVIDSNHLNRLFVINVDNVILKNIKYNMFSNNPSIIFGSPIFINSTSLDLILQISGYQTVNIGNNTNATEPNQYGGNGSDGGEPNQDIGNNTNATEPNQYMGNSINVTVPNQDMGNNANNKQNTVRTLHKTINTKFSPKVIAKNKKFNKKTKVKKYSLILKNNGKSIKNVCVTLKIKGKTFKAKTNNNGQATFKITKLNKRGEFAAKIIFKGNKYYNSVNKNVKIVVK